MAEEMWDDIYNLIRDWQLSAIMTTIIGIILIIRQITELSRQNDLAFQSVQLSKEIVHQNARSVGSFYGGKRNGNVYKAYGIDFDSPYCLLPWGLLCASQSGVLNLLHSYSYIFKFNEQTLALVDPISDVINGRAGRLDNYTEHNQVYSNGSVTMLHHVKYRTEDLNQGVIVVIVVIYSDIYNNLYGSFLKHKISPTQSHGPKIVESCESYEPFSNDNVMDMQQYLARIGQLKNDGKTSPPA